MPKAKLITISGSMFSGKSEELIRRIRRAEYAKRKVIAFKPFIDNRYSINEIKTHLGQGYKSYIIKQASDIINSNSWINDVHRNIENAHDIFIDEVQFVEGDIFHVIDLLLHMDKNVTCSGFDTDYLGSPSKIVPQLMALSDEVIKLYAVCVKCGSDHAIRSHRIIKDDNPVLIGGKEAYEPLCRYCFSQII